MEVQLYYLFSALEELKMQVNVEFIKNTTFGAKAVMIDYLLVIFLE